MVEMWDPARWGMGRAFVGRDREVAELLAGLEDAFGGRVRLLLIAGEPGIGKTWLAEHLAVHAGRRGARVLWVRCWEAGGAPPFWPWSRVLELLDEEHDDQALAAWSDAGAARFPVFEAITGCLRRAAAVRPLLLVMEDLQAADEASRLQLEFLVRDPRGARLLVVGTYRNLTADRVRGIGDELGQLVRDGHLLTLAGLDRREVGELVEALSGTRPSEATVDAVHQATEGNPLFVREAVRLLGEDATLEGPGRLRVPLSGSVRTVIGRRLAPLSADALRVLSAAAVVGREFDLSVVGAACELPVERVLGGLSEAVALGVVAEDKGEEGAVVRYRFAHALIREVLYERLPIPARMELHRRAGDRAMDLHAHEEAAVQYRRALDLLPYGDPDGSRGGGDGPRVAGTSFRREGEYWTVAYGGSVVRLRDSKGLRHLARLLAHPGRELHVVDLEAGELGGRRDLGDAGAMLDANAKAAYQARLGELQAEIEEAEGGNDPARAAKARDERDFLVAELARAVGLGGRDRRAASHAERARLNATRAIRTAMANLARANPALGRHLAATIRTGRYCTYTPDPRAPIIWD